MAKWLTCLLIFLVLASCTNDIVVSESRSLPGYWDKQESLEFQIPQLDSLKKYNVFLNVRNTNDYPFNNLFLIVAMEFPHGKTLVDTLEYKMAFPNGEWMGEGIGSVKENKLWYKENVSFYEEGNYNITITHAVRNNGDVEGVSRLEGITDVGYSIEENKEQ
ncbi:gliding motility lipoprotein GldH [Aureitalea sp. L0-47]|uniref:gliding motility lipoprotein GldH n=1 Tax=Aureitalea sp. L0-47 TaxID=2816962 RepID=UPI002237D6DE|nr:gliding motility lipoprotein GldH [Aureitalea sp. L0-47]MCW5519998.1 gliding motility lipoprotein GldH [Aureitalea sp. L0-47]